MINVPVGALALALAPRVIPESRTPRAGRPDLLGMLLVTCGLTAIVLPLVEGRQHGWPLWTWISLALAPVILAGFWSHERRLERRGGAPLLSLELFETRSFTAGLVAQLVFWCGQASFFLILALYLQLGRGLSALQSGLVFTILAVSYLAASLRAPALTERHGRRVLAVGATTLAIGHAALLAAVAVVGVGGSIMILVPGLLLVGAGMGLGITPLATIIMANMKPEQAGATSGVLSTAQNVGNALGVALIGVVFFGALNHGYATAFELSLGDSGGHARRRRVAHEAAAGAGTLVMVTTVENRVGLLLRDWRQRRRLSQLDLALEAGVSTRHLSFVETGRSRPSPEMVLTLADQLEVPLRERNQLLLAAGYAPQYDARSLDDPELAQIRDALGKLLAGHEPYPAFAVDRRWNMQMSNSALGPLLDGVADELLVPPVNCIRVALHPDGLAPRILNLGDWRGHLLKRLGRELQLTGDPELEELHQEVLGYPGPVSDTAPEATAIMVELHLAAPGGGELAFFSTITTFGTSSDVTVSELSVEAFFPADGHTAQRLRGAE